MGFVRRYLKMEMYLDAISTEWQLISDYEYRVIIQTLNDSIEQRTFSEYEGDEAYNAFKERLPLDGYLFSAPGHKYLSAYDSGGSNLTFGYTVKNLSGLSRKRVNSLECIATDLKLSFFCSFNHEWESLLPEWFLDFRTDS